MPVVYNQGTNYTLYYNALDYFKTIMTNHPSIAKVTTGDMMEVDTREFPMYPIGNINIFNTNISDSTTKFEIQLVVADKIKNKDNESNPINNEQTIGFYGVDDTIDILANTLAIINDLTSYTEYAVAAFDIDSDIVCEPFVDRFNNGLAGHVATFTLTTHNDRNRCLFFLINPSGSGYQIQDCTTSETYYAVLNTQVATGSVFSSTYPYPGACYQVLEKVEQFDSWNLVGLPIETNWDTCEPCNGCYYDTLDIVRNGLVFAFDWTSFNQNGTLTDKSVNGYNANWSGSLTTSSKALEFDGTSSYIAFDINANSMYNSWKWTIDTYGIINDVDNASTFGSLIAYNFTNGITPAWSFAIQTSGSTTPDLITYNNLVATKDAPITASLTLPHQFTYIGRQSASADYSAISLSMDTNHLSGSGPGINTLPFRSFNGAFQNPQISPFSLQKFGGPGLTYESPFGPITWNALSGSIQYILYYNRDLTQAEVEQNNDFFKCGKAIKNPATTTTTTTTTLAPTTTTTTESPLLDIQYLIVAGGGGGSNDNYEGAVATAAGGGAGGYISGSTILSGSNSLSVVVGTGGTAGTFGGSNNQSGTNSTFLGLEAIGGGYGGRQSGLGNGANGGSGGGGFGEAGAGGNGTAGQGFQGNSGGALVGLNLYRGGNGGGASSAPYDIGDLGARIPGLSKQWLDGFYYSSGGKGAGLNNDPTNPGVSGNGGIGASMGVGTAGQNGIVKIRYAGTPRATGGDISQSGGYTYHTFSTNGTFVWSAPTTTTLAP